MYSAIADAIEAEYGPLTEAQRSAVADVLAACLRACAAELSDRLGLK
jgi:hypothetical protein